MYARERGQWMYGWCQGTGSGLDLFKMRSSKAPAATGSDATLRVPGVFV